KAFAGWWPSLKQKAGASTAPLRGMVVLSGYPCPLYDELYITWHRVDRHAYADGSRERIECLWLNSAALEGLAQLDFFQASNASPSPSFQTTAAHY
ncbi:TPA: hypothetical protein ACGW14_006221, partial [Pseudomonas aeruginosa]